MRRREFFLFLGLLGALSVSACVERSEELSAAQRERVRSLVSTTATTPSHPLDIAFGENVQLIGYDLSEEAWARGTELTVTWHWKVLGPIGEDYRLFTHVEARGMDTLNHDGDGAVRGLYPPSRWQAGEYVRDEQRIHLPADWSADQAVFYLGFWRGAERLPVVRGPHDGDNRARVLGMPVTGGTPTPRGPPPLPELQAGSVLGDITLDGHAREPGWVTSRWSPPFVQTMNGAPGRFEAQVRVAYDATHLYVAFRVSDTDLRSPHRDADDHLWEQDCVEVFLDPDGDGRNYFEIQVSPRGVVFDTRYDSRRQPQPFGHVDWQSQAEVAVALRGTLDDDQVDEGYDVELRIPYSALAAGPTPVTPPVAGATWRMNFYVMDKSAQGQDAVGWSPVLVPDFHATDRFGRVSFRAPLVTGGGRADPERPSVEATNAELDARGEAVREAAERTEAANRPGRGERPAAP